MSVAFLLAVEGIDGSGKGTQSTLLVKGLTDRGLRVGFVSFPRYRQTRFGVKIADYLNGRFGNLDQVDPVLVSLLFAGDRFESRGELLQQCQGSDIVICDRYVGSNAAHQGAKVDPDRRDELLRWIHFVEYELFQLPRPDLTILLDVTVASAQQMVLKKAPRTYTADATDLHEADGDYLAKVRDLYLMLASDDPSWKKIQCEGSAGVRSVSDISAELLEVVWQAYLRHTPGGSRG